MKEEKKDRDGWNRRTHQTAFGGGAELFVRRPVASPRHQPVHHSHTLAQSKYAVRSAHALLLIFLSRRRGSCLRPTSLTHPTARRPAPALHPEASSHRTQDRDRLATQSRAWRILPVRWFSQHRDLLLGRSWVWLVDDGGGIGSGAGGAPPVAGSCCLRFLRVPVGAADGGAAEGDRLRVRAGRGLHGHRAERGVLQPRRGRLALLLGRQQLLPEVQVLRRHLRLLRRRHPLHHRPQFLWVHVPFQCQCRRHRHGHRDSHDGHRHHHGHRDDDHGHRDNHGGHLQPRDGHRLQQHRVQPDDREHGRHRRGGGHAPVDQTGGLHRRPPPLLLGAAMNSVCPSVSSHGRTH